MPAVAWGAPAHAAWPPAAWLFSSWRLLTPAAAAAAAAAGLRLALCWHAGAAGLMRLRSLRDFQDGNFLQDPRCHFNQPLDLQLAIVRPAILRRGLGLLWWTPHRVARGTHLHAHIAVSDSVGRCAKSSCQRLDSSLAHTHGGVWTVGRAE